MAEGKKEGKVKSKCLEKGGEKGMKDMSYKLIAMAEVSSLGKLLKNSGQPIFGIYSIASTSN